MIRSDEKNPVYELEKTAIKQRYLVGKLDDDGCIETNEKIMYDFMEQIYEKGAEKAKRPSIWWYVLCVVGGAVVGAAASAVIVVNLIKVK